MATNWNAILSNANSLADILMILRKVLAGLDAKADTTTIDEALEDIEKLKINVEDEIEYFRQVINESIESGLYVPFAKQDDLLAYVPNAEPVVGKAFDTDKVWIWETRAPDTQPHWHDTGLSEKDQANQFTMRAVRVSQNGVMRVPFTPSTEMDDGKSYFINAEGKIAYFLKNGLYADHYTLNGKKIENPNVRLMNMPLVPEIKQTVIDIYGSSGAVGVGEGWIDVNKKTYGLITKLKVPLVPADGEVSEQYVLPNGYVVYPPHNAEPPVIEIPDVGYQQKYPTWVSDGISAKIYDELGLKATIPKPVLAPFAISEKVAVAVVEDGVWFSPSAMRQMAITTLGATFPNPDRYLIIIPTYGQSLSVGSGGVPIYTTVDKNPLPDRLLKFKGFSVTFNRTGGSGVIRVIEPSELTDFEALAAFDLGNNYSGETLAEQMIIQLANKIDSSGGVRFLTYAAGVGGTTIEQLGPGSDGYKTFMNVLIGAKNIAAKKGLKIIVPAFVWQHGESGTNGYKANLTNLRTQLEADIKLITGQSMNVHCYMASPANAVSTSQYQYTQAMYELSRDDSANFTQVGGVYECQPYSDFVHLTTRGYTLLGSKYADAIYHDFVNGFGSYKAVTPKSVTRTDNVIEIEFHVPKPPLKFMTNDVVYDVANKGFAYVDSTNSATISNVEILPNGTTVRITLSAIPTGTNKKIRAGWNGSGKTYETRQRTNLCDSNNGKSVMNDDLNHFCLTFEENVA